MVEFLRLLLPQSGGTFYEMFHMTGGRGGARVMGDNFSANCTQEGGGGDGLPVLASFFSKSIMTKAEHSETNHFTFIVRQIYRL